MATLARSRPAAPDTGLRLIQVQLTKRRDPNTDTPLTKREGQVRRHLTYGLHDPEIAKSLAISIMTMKEHLQKKDVKDRTKAAVWAIDG